MPKPTAAELQDVLRELALEAQARRNPQPTLKIALQSVMSGTVNQRLQLKGFDRLDAPEISLAKTALANVFEPPKPPAPFKFAYPSPPEFSFRYWFNYFYVELPNLERKQHFYDLITLPGGTFKDEKDLDLKKLLKDMCTEGFEEFTIMDKVDPEELYRDSAKNFELQRQGVRVVFRGDGRTPEQIESNMGTSPQSRIDFLRQKSNMDKDWHPFKTMGNKVFFRKGFNADNCLFTAISVTPEFYTATKFPMQDELRATNPGALGVASVEVVPQHTAPTTRTGGLVQSHLDMQKPEVKALNASKTTIYVVRTTGGWNTQKRQMQLGAGSFPEYSFEHIPWIYHLASVKVIRLHYGAEANDGHQIVVEGWKWLQSKSLLERILNSAVAVQRLEEFLEGLQSQGSAAAGGIAYLPPGVPAPDWKIKKILNPFTPGTGKLDKGLLTATVSTPVTKPVLQPSKKATIKSDTSWIKH
jgi:hypothetical protein